MAAVGSVSERLTACKLDVERLKAAIDAKKSALQNGGLRDVDAHRRPLGPALKRRRTLAGHHGKVYACDWAIDGETVVSTGQDSKLLHWDPKGNHKLASVPLKVIWAMTCAFDPGTEGVVACGGLDNTCSFYSLKSGERLREFQGHEGYLSCIRFLGIRGSPTGQVVTASGDSTCCIWDVKTGTRIRSFDDHGSDVLTLSPSPTDPHVFVSGSVDSSARVWDTRTARCAQLFVGHEGDINAVQFLPSGLGFGTAGDDSAVKIYDLRSCAKLNDMGSDAVVTSATSLDFSHSGRIVFAGHDDCNVYAWDSLADRSRTPWCTLAGHANHVSCLSTSPSGHALATGSWDHELGIWA